MYCIERTGCSVVYMLENLTEICDIIYSNFYPEIV